MVADMMSNTSEKEIQLHFFDFETILHVAATARRLNYKDSTTSRKYELVHSFITLPMYFHKKLLFTLFLTQSSSPSTPESTHSPSPPRP